MNISARIKLNFRRIKMIDNTNEKRENERDRLKKTIEAKMGFFTHLAIYLVVNAVVFFPNNLSEGFSFVYMPSLGWGIGLAAHFIKTFIFNNDYIERKVDEAAKR